MKNKVQEWQIDNVLSLKACSKGIQLIYTPEDDEHLHNQKIETFKMSVRQAEELTEILSMIYPNSVYRHIEK